jgi:very-short-patch-repair endonuclease
VYKKTTEEFITEANQIHNNLYDYSTSIYKNNREKISVICEKHGAFQVTPNDHLNKKSGCPKCKSSKGEIRIETFLNNQKIKYISQHIFNDCKNIKNLVFDFYLPDQNVCIEFDGQLHFKSIDFFGGDELLKNTKKRDKIKTKYCLDKNIKLIRIKYDKFNDIENILLKNLNI